MVALASRAEDCGVRLAYEGRLTAADVDPAAQPLVALALLDEGVGSPERARLLAADPLAGHRAKPAACPGLPPDVVETLAADRDVRVVAELALWAEPDMAARLARNPRVPLDVLAHLAATTRIAATLLPRIAAATAAEVEELARSPHAAVRMLLARRRDLPAGIRDALADDPDAKVVRSVAPHPGLSAAQLRAMADRYGAQVVAGAAANPDATPAFLEHVTRRRPPVRKALREVARHPRATAPALLACLADDRARPLAAGHPALPPQVVVDLLTDADERVAEAAAANPSLPLTAMTELLALAGRR